MTDSPRKRSVDDRVAIFAVTLLGVVGSIVFLLLPLMVGAFTERLGLDAGRVGLLGSADMAGMFLAAALAWLWVRRTGWRRVATAACALLVVCHLASAALDSLPSLLAARVAAGFAGGTLMSIALTSLGDTHKPDRYFALFISAQLGLGALALWRVPALLEAFGLAGLFVALALLTVAAAAAITFIPGSGRFEPEASRAGTAGRSSLAGLAALAACLLFNLGIMAVWAYVERIGDAAGLSTRLIGGALGGSLLVGLGGALVAAVLVDRYGRALPIGISLGLQLVALVLLAGDPSAVAFTLAVALFSFCWNFPVAYQLAITVSVDTTGRLVVLFLGAVKLGYALGPALAGRLLEPGDGFTPVLVLGALGFVASAAVYLPLALRAPRTTPMEEPA